MSSRASRCCVHRLFGRRNRRPYKAYSVCWTASSVVTQALTFNHSIFHSLASRREARLCSVTGHMTPSQTADKALPP